MTLTQAPTILRHAATSPGVAVHTAVDSCRACGTRGLATLHEFGSLPLANALRTTAELEYPERRVPLTLALCEACSLVQIRETVDPEVLFADYRYFSSYSTTTLAYAEALATALCTAHGLDGDSLVVEVGSNDGYLLAPFQARGVPVLGIEPAANIAAVARARGVPTENVFFGSTTAQALANAGHRCDLLLANNVLAHTADLPGFVAGIATLLRPTGRAVVEVPYLGDLLAHGEWDTIYHEHLCYFSATALQRLFAAAGLHVHRIERLARHGGSLRLTVAPVPPPAMPAAVAALVADEAAAGFARAAAYAPFTAGIARTRDALQEALAALQRQGRPVAAYGASAKGSTLLNVCGVRREQLLFLADRSPHKQGRYAPGNQVPIVAPEQILVRQPDALLLLAWNFADEIMAQQAEYRRRGGRFLVPVPEVHWR